VSDRLTPIPFDRLVAWVFDEIDAKGSVLGIPKELFWSAGADDTLTREVFSQRLENPFGVAAGPHSQMAQNILVAWLCGARFIELKTVQTLDRLEISKPCISMPDEGYNVEWSQELTLEQSLDEYLRAWVLVHALHRHLQLPGDGPGTIFNLSVGYDLAGIRQPNMQRFLEGMREPGPRLDELTRVVLRRCPGLDDLHVPELVADNVTLSTMHGCPPDEIGRIARHLMHDWGLHTTVKLNPTLLGPERVRHILNERLGYRHVVVPDLAFEHDLRYDAALDLLAELEAEAQRSGVDFSVKLSNTLQVEHRGDVFDTAEASMYLSGRPLHALTVNLAHRLAEDHRGLVMSFAGGADAHNAARLIACGMCTVTACSDLLRPGGYTRLGQYLSVTAEAMAAVGATGIDDYICRTAVDTGTGGSPPSPRRCARRNLARYAERTLDDPLLHHDAFDRDNTSTPRPLGLFDCIEAPCVATCPIGQKVPEYMRLVESGRFADAAAVIRADNPLGAILGRACTHACETPCTRTHYDEPVAIREIKRFVMDRADVPLAHDTAAAKAPVAIVGGGPCGLAAASSLAAAGYPVTVYDAHRQPGGMVSGTIPGFRARPTAVEQDLRRLEAHGIDVRTGEPVTLPDVRAAGFELVVVAAGAQRGRRLGIPGENAEGVLDGLDFLRAVRHGPRPQIGDRVGVIGGGDVAMDCARAARRLGAEVVVVLYRRTRSQMPAHPEELAALDEEQVEVQELVAPLAADAPDGRLTAVRCARMRLGPPDDSGRARPEPIPGAEVSIPLDTMIVAVGQEADLGFLGEEPVGTLGSGFLEVDPRTQETAVPGLYAGGDVVRGPATIVEAVADGQRIARSIRRRVEGWEPPPAVTPPELDPVELLARRSRRVRRVEVPQLDPSARADFAEVVATLDDGTARREAARCLSCDVLCSTCVTVCPNRALMTVPFDGFRAELPRLRRAGERLEQVGTRAFAVDQRFQVVVLADLCNECGNCSTFCPTTGDPYRDKPRLYLDADQFGGETDNAFMLQRRGTGWLVLGAAEGEVHRLSFAHELHYQGPLVEAVLDPVTLHPVDARSTARCGQQDEVSLELCATMLVLASSLSRGMPELPSAVVDP
jgi:putative selenate reductase